jgi:hypothetical protein
MQSRKSITWAPTIANNVKTLTLNVMLRQFGVRFGLIDMVNYLGVAQSLTILGSCLLMHFNCPVWITNLIVCLTLCLFLSIIIYDTHVLVVLYYFLPFSIQVLPQSVSRVVFAYTCLELSQISSLWRGGVIVCQAGSLVIGFSFSSFDLRDANQWYYIHQRAYYSVRHNTIKAVCRRLTTLLDIFWWYVCTCVRARRSMRGLIYVCYLLPKPFELCSITICVKKVNEPCDTHLWNSPDQPVQVGLSKTILHERKKI